jgi:hypothetical protein
LQNSNSKIVVNAIVNGYNRRTPGATTGSVLGMIPYGIHHNPADDLTTTISNPALT